MREITITKSEFDDLLYPAVGSSSAENEIELEVALRVMRKLKDSSITYEEDIDPEEAARVKREGGRLIAFKRLRSPEHIFAFEEDEWKLILARLKAYIPRVTLLAADELWTLIQRVSNVREEKQVSAASL